MDFRILFSILLIFLAQYSFGLPQSPQQNVIRVYPRPGQFIPKGHQSAIISSTQAPNAEQQAKILKQINKVNEDGSYTYGFESDDGSYKVETRDKDGIVKGKYGFIDTNGELKTIEYTAGEKGNPGEEVSATSDDAQASPAPEVAQKPKRIKIAKFRQPKAQTTSAPSPYSNEASPEDFNSREYDNSFFNAPYQFPGSTYSPSALGHDGQRQRPIQFIPFQHSQRPQHPFGRPGPIEQSGPIGAAQETDAEYFPGAGFQQQQQQGGSPGFNPQRFSPARGPEQQPGGGRQYPGLRPGQLGVQGAGPQVRFLGSPGAPGSEAAGASPTDFGSDGGIGVLNGGQFSNSLYNPQGIPTRQGIYQQQGGRAGGSGQGQYQPNIELDGYSEDADEDGYVDEPPQTTSSLGKSAQTTVEKQQNPTSLRSPILSQLGGGAAQSGVNSPGAVLQHYPQGLAHQQQGFPQGFGGQSPFGSPFGGGPQFNPYQEGPQQQQQHQHLLPQQQDQPQYLSAGPGSNSQQGGSYPQQQQQPFYYPGQQQDYPQGPQGQGQPGGHPSFQQYLGGAQDLQGQGGFPGQNPYQGQFGGQQYSPQQLQYLNGQSGLGQAGAQQQPSIHSGGQNSQGIPPQYLQGHPGFSPFGGQSQYSPYAQNGAEGRQQQQQGFPGQNPFGPFPGFGGGQSPYAGGGQSPYAAGGQSPYLANGGGQSPYLAGGQNPYLSGAGGQSPYAGGAPGGSRIGQLVQLGGSPQQAGQSESSAEKATQN